MSLADWLRSRFPDVGERSFHGSACVDDRTLSVATDGFAIVAIDEVVPGYSNIGNHIGGGKILTRPRGATTVSLASLRKWVGDHAYAVEQDRPDACPECNGDGAGECSHCGHETDCETCGGTGDAETTHREIVRADGETIGVGDWTGDPTLLCHVLPDTNEDVTIGVDGHELRIHGNGWLAVVMGRRAQPDDVKRRFGLGGEVAA